MRIKDVSGRNFASYKELAFDVADKGLTLIAGPTGSGKSTLCDVVPWVLFGKTAKGGSVDEIRSWGVKGTTGSTITVQTSTGDLTVTRSRSPNDLYFTYDAEPVRGKDLADTQKLINAELGMDYDTYLAGAYFHEFSQTASFFTATAKSRRETIEELVDLSLATRLTTSLTDYRKEIKTELETDKANLTRVSAGLAVLTRQLTQATDRAGNWNVETAATIKRLSTEAQNFDEVKKARLAELEKGFIRENLLTEGDLAEVDEQLNDLNKTFSKYGNVDADIAAIKDTRCEHCGSRLHSDKILLLTKQANKRDADASKQETLRARLVTLHARLETQAERYTERRAAVEASTFTQHEKLSSLKTAQNPHADAVETIKADIASFIADERKLKADISTMQTEFADVELLLDLTGELRKECVKSCVVEIQTRTNDLLTRFFDAEIKVVFTADEADKIDVQIFKDGNSCVYTQLSKGQRQMLKLCFGISVMQSVNNRTNGFNALFFDEALDGLSEELKVKAYKLFEFVSTNYSTVFVVEHSEALKAMFNTRIDVRLIDGNSEIAD